MNDKFASTIANDATFAIQMTLISLRVQTRVVRRSGMVATLAGDREPDRLGNVDPVTLGFVAGALTTFASLPQIIYVIKTRSMKDISLTTLLMFTSGVALWLSYGIQIRAFPVIIWNLLSLCLYLAQIGLKLGLSPYGMALLAQVRRMPARGSA